jgi:hypothetical protein
VVTTRNRSCAASANKALPAISPALADAANAGAGIGSGELLCCAAHSFGLIDRRLKQHPHPPAIRTSAAKPTFQSRQREVLTARPDQRLRVEFDAVGSLAARLPVRRVRTVIGAWADASPRIVCLAYRLDGHKNKIGTWIPSSQAGVLFKLELGTFCPTLARGGCFSAAQSAEQREGFCEETTDDNVHTRQRQQSFVV